MRIHYRNGRLKGEVPRRIPCMDVAICAETEGALERKLKAWRGTLEEGKEALRQKGNTDLLGRKIKVCYCMEI